ncbi:hypothetical protein ACWDUL_33785 [Nocardia niigatensis]
MHRNTTPIALGFVGGVAATVAGLFVTDRYVDELYMWRLHQSRGPLHLRRAGRARAAEK